MAPVWPMYTMGCCGAKIAYTHLYIRQGIIGWCRLVSKKRWYDSQTSQRSGHKLNWAMAEGLRYERSAFKGAIGIMGISRKLRIV